jgi:hypothetical protein
MTPPTGWDQRCTCTHIAVRHDGTKTRTMAGRCLDHGCECTEFNLKKEH